MARELEELGGSFPNDYDRDIPIPSGLSFLLQEYSYHLVRSGDQERRQQIEVLASWVDEALGRWWRQRFAGRTESDITAASRTAKFRIQHVPVALDNWNWLPHVGPYLADVLFERGSAPWTLLRESSFRGAEMRDAGSVAEMTRLINSGETGPFACLVSAAVLGRDNPKSTASIARLGLSRMDEAYVRQDLHALFTEGDGMRAALDAIGAVARSMPSDAREGILARLPHGLDNVLEDWSRELDRAPEAAPADLLVELFVHEWHDKLGVTVNDLLQQYVQWGENAATR